MNKKYLMLGIALIIIDQIVKILMIDKILIVIPGFLNFTYTKNLGAAFGLGNPVMVLIVNILLVVGIIIFIIKYKDKITSYIPITMLLAGAIGNLIDRIFRGYVIDFIDINLFNFPVFNIADICVVLGVIILIFEIIKKQIKNNRSAT